MALIFPFPLRGANDGRDDRIFGFLHPANSQGKPFHHLPSSLSGVRALLDVLPHPFLDIAQPVIDVDWKTWLDGGGLETAARVWMAQDQMATWNGAQTLPEMLKKTRTDWAPENDGDFTALLEKAMDHKDVQQRIETAAGEEPVETRGATYEEWSGYDSKGGAINKEDWWKDGGREGMAESRKHSDWADKVTTLSRSYPLYLQIVFHLVTHRPFAISFVKAYDESLTLVKHHLVRYSAIRVPSDTKVALSSPRGQLIRLLLNDPAPLITDPSIQDLIKKIATEAVGTQFGGDDRAIGWYDRLLAIKESKEPAEYHFPASLKPNKRAMLHELAEKLGLKHESEGMEARSQEGKKQKKRAKKKGQVFVERHVVVNNY